MNLEYQAYGGIKQKLMYRQVQLGSFVLRLWDFPSYDLLPGTIFKELDEQAPNAVKWIRAVVKEKSVNHIWDAENVARRTKAKFAPKV